MSRQTRLLIAETFAALRSGFGSSPGHERAPEIVALEQRILMSASPAAMIADATVMGAGASDAGVQEGLESFSSEQGTWGSAGDTVTADGETVDAAAVSGADESHNSSDAAIAGIAEQNAETVNAVELVVIDPSVAGYQQLLDDLQSQQDRTFEVLLLNPREDGVAQISDALRSLEGVSAIHLISHAEDGEILLGTGVLSRQTFDRYAAELLTWNSSLNQGADLLIYGCDLAADPSGRELLGMLNAVLNADVAGSDDATGNENFGGDWDLEYAIGEVKTDVVFSAGLQQSWLGKLNSITVTTTADTINSGDGLTSLREAIIQANAGAGGDTILLGAGTYVLSRAGEGEDAAATGDLDISKSVSIVGGGPGVTIIDASGFSGSPDRVVHIFGGITVSIEGITITGGGGVEGAGVFIDGGATVNISQSAIVANDTGGNDGGGVYIKDGTVTMTDVTIADNSATGKSGGGIFNHGTLTLDRVTISGNTATNGGGVQSRTAASSVLMTNVTISGNTATNKGGGIETNRDITIVNSTIAFNKGADGGGINDTGGLLTLKNSILAYNTLLDGTTADNVVGTLISNGHNIDSDGTAGLSGTGDLSNVDPLLAPLANNGGFVQTHALPAGSTAIDGGTSTGAPTKDARGLLHDTTVDIGAFAAVGMTTTGEISVNQTTANVQVTSGETRGSQQAVAVDGAGNYVVVWSTNQTTGGDANGWAVMARMYAATGTPISGEFLVNQTTVGNQQWARVARANDGTFVVTWTSGTVGSEDVYIRRFAADGTALTGEIRANTTATGGQKNSDIAIDRDTGNFVVAWQGEGPGDSGGVFYRRFAADGTALDGTDQQANTTTANSEKDPSVAMNSAGEFIITWADASNIFVRKFDAAGSELLAEMPLPGTSSPSLPSVALREDGSFMIGARSDVAFLAGAYVRAFNSDGSNAQAGWQALKIGSAATATSIAVAENGDYVVVFE
ncbi:MAG: DUF4347 domain-containing protein, partial [Planctomycetaceae bacterium]|nr:DUF4347 domain-containing protein [Planctomycetaceae bacterium]